METNRLGDRGDAVTPVEAVRAARTRPLESTDAGVVSLALDKHRAFGGGE